MDNVIYANFKKERKTMEKKIKTCCICASVDQTLKYVGNFDNMVCEKCIEDMHHAIAEDKPVEKFDSHVTPKSIIAETDKYVVGQDSAKQDIAIAIYNHYKRMKHGGNNEVELQKSNILMVGPSGTGKTLIAQSIAKFLDLPIAIVDATSLTQAGYVGNDVETILQRLIQVADGDIKKAEYGIIFCDEADKLAKRDSGASITRDVSGEGVQQALLKIIEGTTVQVMQQGNRMTPGAANNTIDTTNILFICAGAFVGLDEIMKKNQIKSNYGIGFTSEVKDKNEPKHILNPTPADLYEFGLIPEFVGRLPVITTLLELTVDDLKHVLTETKNSVLKQFQYLFELEGTTLEVTEEAITKIAETAHTRKTGARGLRSIMEVALKAQMLENPENPAKKIVLDVVENELTVIIGE